VSASRPYVDRPVTDRDAALRAAGGLAETWRLPAPKLLRHGMNSLYLAGGVVLRVGAATAPAAASHELARWLIDAGIPTVPPVDGLAADADGFAVTGWRFVPETRRAVDWRAVGAAVRRVHALDPADVPEGYPVPDPSTFPWWAFDELLDDVADELDPVTHDALRTTIDHHRGWRESVRRSPVLCHGDVHPGNVLMSGSGALLVDWDLMCVADPAWDHAMLTTYAERWGGDAAAYAAFAGGYGHSLADDELTTTLAELRNVAATLMRVRAGRTDPAAADEAARRLRWWRGDPEAPAWRAQ
jgi:aminoglycoside phosphotransferase (APT) family kinase protein